MDGDVFLSYVIPCYNVQKYLPECIESLAIQKIDNGTNVEFIFVNDGSVDDTLIQLKEFVAKDERAKLVDQVNQGVCVARNNGLRIAKGKYVFFLDGDDFLTDEASLLIYNESQKGESDIIIPKAYMVNEGKLDMKMEWDTFSGIPSGIYSTQDLLNSIASLPISVKVYKREILVNNNVYFDEDLKVGEVYTFFFHALAYSNYVNLSDGHMMNWVMRQSGTSKGYNLDRDKLVLKTMHRINEYSHLFDFNLQLIESYQKSLYYIVNFFSVSKYINYPNFSNDIIAFLNSIVKDDIYQNILKYFIYTKRKYNVFFLKILFLYLLPIKALHYLHCLFKR